jgi:hypothetical protein
LSVDCDRFFDEVADANEKYIEHELKERMRQRGPRGGKQIEGVDNAPVILSQKQINQDA